MIVCRKLQENYLVFDVLMLMIPLGNGARENDDRISSSQFFTISHVRSC